MRESVEIIRRPNEVKAHTRAHTYTQLGQKWNSHRWLVNHYYKHSTKTMDVGMSHCTINKKYMKNILKKCPPKNSDWYNHLNKYNGIKSHISFRFILYLLWQYLVLAKWNKINFLYHAGITKCIRSHICMYALYFACALNHIQAVLLLNATRKQKIYLLLEGT